MMAKNNKKAGGLFRTAWPIPLPNFEMIGRYLQYTEETLLSLGRHRLIPTRMHSYSKADPLTNVSFSMVIVHK